MIMKYEQLSSRYATAFLNLFIDQMNAEDALAVYHTHLFFSEHRSLTFFLDLPTISLFKKHEMVRLLFEKNKFFEPLKKLFDLLIKHKRTVLFSIVLRHIWWQYLERMQKDFFEITCSHDLSPEQQKIVKKFLVRVTGKGIMYVYAQDKELIAGIRAQSDCCLWEHSVRKQLRCISHSLNA